MITHTHEFTKEEVKEIMKIVKTDDPKVALKDWAYHEYAMQHCADYFIGKVGNTFVEVIEQ